MLARAGATCRPSGATPVGALPVAGRAAPMDAVGHSSGVRPARAAREIRVTVRVRCARPAE
ncbi:hypothetical protein [Streptomyces hebeiensis]